MKNEKDLSSKILESIKEKKIKPKPRWEFLIKDYIILTSGIISIIIGALAVAVIIFMVLHSNRDLLSFLDNSKLEYFLLSLPYYWFLFFSLFIVLAYFNIKHFKRGYRYTLQSIALISIGLSVILGILFYSVGFGKVIDIAFLKKIPTYKNISHKIPKEFIKPENGILFGKIIKIDNKIIKLKAEPSNKEWNVFIDSLKQKCVPDYKEEDAIIVLGEIKRTGEFLAYGIRPWGRENIFEYSKKCSDTFKEDFNCIRKEIEKRGINNKIKPEMVPGLINSTIAE
jgi:glucan phosphoethanolaminetransferase (alkaline phosphatase superfamily)